MAQVNVSTTSDLSPQSAWKLASDLSRFGDWMTIFGGWRGDVPATITKGTRVSSLIKVKGFRNVIHWEVTRYDEPHEIELSGHGRGGVEITVAMGVTDNSPGSTFDLSADLSGGLLNGPLGKLVARIIKSDVRKSVCNLAVLE
ncbi:SRPBCC family protein [Candidatus Mycobacterium wuenschmannii]|uniref:SRPBCC family protein n=1 Tax=Candidatus Mycobacterium wuenschmannii TaxID=3027808 RepID=A0ABY8VZK1_9MYCO|nr:SRPBCC family protein [Candidatus Mycobacterium wuenschmannii]WIM88922.1 SRPBCC family protein [Candidatus Mycobacterium wuenschmannii]